MLIDKPLAELEQYKPSLTRQHDFDAFWEQTLNESADQPLNTTLHEVAYPVECEHFRARLKEDLLTQSCR